MTQYVNITTGEVTTLYELRRQNPNTMYPDPLTPNEGFARLEEIIPEYDPDTQRLEYSSTASEVNGKWTRTITVVELTQQEKDDIKQSKVPPAVTMRQARLALLGAGLLGSVETSIESLPSPQKDAARIEWEYSQEVQRHNGFVSVLAPLLGLTESQIDDLFILAATL